MQSKQEYINNYCFNGSTLRNLNKNKLAKIKIPIPPLEIQNEIVKILDKFNTLTNDLQSKLQLELKSRKKQYEYYLNELLSFEELSKRSGRGGS